MECDRRIPSDRLPVDQAALARARDIVARRGGPTHLLVRYRGKTLVDDRLGVGSQALFWPYSTSKLWLATLVWALHDDGVLDIEAPVASYWPEFGRAGKHNITIREVLQHRSGLPRVGSTLAEVAAMTHWQRSTARIAAAAPKPKRLERAEYEWLAWGFILAQVVAEATDEQFSRALDKRIMQPLGATSTAQLRPHDTWRRVPFRGTDPTTALVAAVLNRPATVAACIPAGGIWSTATDLADLLDALAYAPHRLGMHSGALERMSAPSNDGEFDRYSGSKVWWGQGVQLGHAARSMMAASSFGRYSTANTIGHNGSNVSMAWHDRDRDLTFVHLSARIAPFPLNRRYLMSVADAVAASVPTATA